MLKHYFDLKRCVLDLNLIIQQWLYEDNFCSRRMFNIQLNEFIPLSLLSSESFMSKEEGASGLGGRKVWVQVLHMQNKRMCFTASWCHLLVLPHLSQTLIGRLHHETELLSLDAEC